MQSRARKSLLLIVAAFLCFGLNASAQFKSGAFSQNYNDDSKAPADTTQEPIFDFKEFWGGLTHKSPAKVQTMFEGSTVLLGGMQIYNKQYWKLPIVYGGIAAGVGSGIYLSNHGNSDAAKWCYIGAGVTYWAALMDGVVSYQPNDYPSPGKATLYSLLCPGLGQIYNHEMWKIPVYVGGMVGSLYYHNLYKRNYERFVSMQKSGVGESMGISTSTSKYYRDIYRRYRDYATLACVAFYFLQVIDANVFAYMHNFEITDDLAIYTEPAVILPPDNQYAFAPGRSAVGMSFGIRF